MRAYRFSNVVLVLARIENLGGYRNTNYCFGLQALVQSSRCRMFAYWRVGTGFFVRSPRCNNVDITVVIMTAAFLNDFCNVLCMSCGKKKELMGHSNQGEASSGAVETAARTLTISRFVSICFYFSTRHFCWQG